MYSSSHTPRRCSKGIIIMAKKKRKKHPQRVQQIEQNKELDKKLKRGNLLRLACLIAVTAVVFGFYRLMMNFRFFGIVMIGYIAICTVAVFTYVIYNRGFSRKGLTEDMLPDSMTKEEKKEFIEDGERRLKKSRPLLIVVFAFAFTFVIDVIELVAIPLFKGMWGR